MVGKLESNAKLNSKVKVEVEVRVELGKNSVICQSRNNWAEFKMYVFK